MPTCRTVLILALLCGCGGGEGGPADGGGPDGAGIPPCEGLFCGPGEFSRDGCGGTPPVGSIDPAGIWHLDIRFPDGANPGVLRIDPSEYGLTALLFGNQANEVALYETDLYVRRTWVNQDETVRLHALDLCAVRDDGSLFGHFATCWDAECSVADVVMMRVEPLDEPVAEGIVKVSEFAGNPPWPTDAITVNVRHHEGIDYLARYGDGLRIVDVGDPAAPFDRGHAPVTYADWEIYNDVKVYETGDGKVWAMCASNLRGIVVYDVTDPDAPVEVTTFPEESVNEPVREVHTLFLDGSRAYLANTGRSSLQIFDIADPAAPQYLGEWIHPDVGTLGGFVHDLYVDAGRVYLFYWNLGMVILDAQANPADPTVVGIFDGYERRTSHSGWATTAGGRKVAVHGDEDFTAHVRIVDVDDQGVAFLDVLAEYETRPQVSVHNIMAVGELAFVTYYQDGFRVLDLANPAQPVERAHFQTWDPDGPAGASLGHGFYEGAIGVDHDAASGLLHVVDTHRGLFLLRLQ